jgi:hypothetical protein
MRRKPVADLTPEEVAELRRLYEDRGPGPWEWSGSDWPSEFTPANVALITAAVAALPALCDSVEAAKGKVLWRGKTLPPFNAKPGDELHQSCIAYAFFDIPAGTEVAVVLTDTEQGQPRTVTGIKAMAEIAGQEPGAPMPRAGEVRPVPLPGQAACSGCGTDAAVCRHLVASRQGLAGCCGACATGVTHAGES